MLGRVQADEEILEGSKAYDCQFIQWVDDYVDLIRGCDIVVLPDVIGTGIKNRAIQSLALGKPTIGTAVAFEGISFPNSDVARVATSNLDIAFHLDQLCASSDLRERIGLQAREFAESRYSQSVVVQRWREAYMASVERQQSKFRAPSG